ncbi:hypothetical protein JVT61DRAFT_10870 [Boletus reticuloceps]|uniref:J domain-containing protein n=1 Tax=Boletus reticuloceps TaxID=495285 RepID=A0A8I2YFE7_9AGAM|nr:hypothetical protein JVT61DRAFT_10870 [Boletus reticuloceps]
MATRRPSSESFMTRTLHFSSSIRDNCHLIGTQEKPLETGYYDILGVPIDVTTEEHQEGISQVFFAYSLYYSHATLYHPWHPGQLAIKHHPRADKNPNNPHAEERFKQIAIAYQTLSDPVLRKKYNEFGPKESSPSIFNTTSLSSSELRKESYRVELLHVIRFVYVFKAKHFLDTSQSLFGVSGWLYNVQGKYHVFSET